MVRKRLLYLCVSGVALAVVVVVLGAFTRLVDAGLGCPDWPGCYGFLTVPETPQEVGVAEARFPDAPVEADKAWWEMIHRYFATTLGFLVVVIAGLVVTNRQADVPLKLPIFLLILVIAQGAFGAWTVTLKLWPQIVTAHLLGGFATLSLLWLMCLRLGVGVGWRIGRTGLLPHIWLGLALLIGQIALGGWVTSNYAALACGDFPTCHGSLWPQMNLAAGFNFMQSVGPNYLGGLLDSEARVAIQVVHRAGAALVLIVVGALAIRLIRSGFVLGWPLAGILVGQICLGIANVIWLLPLGVATLHNAVGALLLLAMVTVSYRAFREERIVE
ncbi:MAG: COX15/CtaA family protein [Gammaproteobacteria bacterium]|nr:COX15/CtaA family protein [Gammaproteobacteria bacterium]